MLLGFVEQLIPHKLPRGENSSRTELLPNASGNEYSTFPASSPKRAPNIPPELLSPDVSAISLRDDSDVSDVSDDEDSRNPAVPRKKYDRDAIVRNLKTQVWTGALLGLGAASLVGAVFLYVVSELECSFPDNSSTPLPTTSGRMLRTSGRVSFAASRPSCA